MEPLIYKRLKSFEQVHIEFKRHNASAQAWKMKVVPVLTFKLFHHKTSLDLHVQIASQAPGLRSIVEQHTARVELQMTKDNCSNQTSAMTKNPSAIVSLMNQKAFIKQRDKTKPLQRSCFVSLNDLSVSNASQIEHATRSLMRLYTMRV